jgi:hypothetical protein
LAVVKIVGPLARAKNYIFFVLTVGILVIVLQIKNISLLGPSTVQSLRSSPQFDEGML